jgi:penicillin-binding protein 1A
VTDQRGAWAKKQPLELAKNVGQIHLPTPPFIVDYVKQQIHDNPNGWYSFLGATAQQRDKALAEGGLSIITTLDPNWQRAAQEAANQPWAATPSHPDHRPTADVGLVSLDATTGAIRTMLSGKNYQKDKVNTVTTVHQPGSSFKPYVLTAAFEQGILPTALYSGVQGVIPDPRCITNGQPWDVTNAEGTSLGSMNLYDATAYSVNAVFARLILDVGPENVVAVAHEMGITTPLPAVCALAVGSVGISPLDQASGYQTLANGGIHCKPFAVAEVLLAGRSHYRAPDCQQVVPAPIANLVSDLPKGPSRTDRRPVFSSVGASGRSGEDGTAGQHGSLVRRVHAAGRRRPGHR